MAEGKRQRNNQRQARRKKERHATRVERTQQERLYAEARLDPQTVEGQGRAKIEVISPPVSPVAEPTQPKTWTDTFWSLFGY